MRMMIILHPFSNIHTCVTLHFGHKGGCYALGSWMLRISGVYISLIWVSSYKLSITRLYTTLTRRLTFGCGCPVDPLICSLSHKDNHLSAIKHISLRRRMFMFKAGRFLRVRRLYLNRTGGTEGHGKSQEEADRRKTEADLCFSSCLSEPFHLTQLFLIPPQSPRLSALF